MIVTTLALKILGNFFVPQGYISFAIINDWPKFRISAEVVHEVLHAIDTAYEVDDFVLRMLFVQGTDGVFDSFTEDGW